WASRIPAPPSTTATPPAIARPWKSRSGYSSDSPVTSETAPSPTTTASAAEARIRRTEEGRSTAGLPHRAGDHDPLDLVGALVDLGDLGVAHHALDRVLVDVAVAAEHLDGLDRDVHRRVGGEQLRHRRVAAELGVAAVGERARLVEQLARGGRPSLHVGELELDRLLLEDRLAERDA